MKNRKFVYARMGREFGLFRLGGCGLANSLILASRAYVYSLMFDRQFIEPTWINLSIGTYLRKETDKRHYLNLFNRKGIFGFKKMLILMFVRSRKIGDDGAEKASLIRVDSMFNQFSSTFEKDFFADLLKYHDLVVRYIYTIRKHKTTSNTAILTSQSVIGVHIRMGDYPDRLRTPIDWYKEFILEIQNLGFKGLFILFSDGNESDLYPLLAIRGVVRSRNVDAADDIFDLADCKLILGSNSTFSGLAAFLKQVPILFYQRHFGSVLNDKENELVCQEVSEGLSLIKKVLKLC